MELGKVVTTGMSLGKKVAGGVGKKDLVYLSIGAVGTTIFKKTLDKKNSLLLEAADSLDTYEKLSQSLADEVDELRKKVENYVEVLRVTKEDNEKEARRAAKRIAESKITIEELQKRLEEATQGCSCGECKCEKEEEE